MEGAYSVVAKSGSYASRIMDMRVNEKGVIIFTNLRWYSPDVGEISQTTGRIFARGNYRYINRFGREVEGDVDIVKLSNGQSYVREVGKAGSFSDETLEAWSKFDDNVLDVADAGKQNWKTFQNRTNEQLKNRYPGKKIGNQITLDVTFTKDGQTFTITIIPDNLIPIEANGVMKYKVIDVKTSVKHDLTQMNDLTSTCTQNQWIVYKMLDGDATVGTITKVEMRGVQATVFDNEVFVNGKAQILLESNIEFWVNSSTTDFTQYLVRRRIK